MLLFLQDQWVNRSANLFLKNWYLFKWFSLHWVFVAAHWLSLVAVIRGLLSSYRVQASHCRGISCCKAWAPGCTSSTVASSGFSRCSMGLIAPWHVGSSNQASNPIFPALAGGVLHHWTTREARSANLFWHILFRYLASPRITFLVHIGKNVLVLLRLNCILMTWGSC